MTVTTISFPAARVDEIPESWPIHARRRNLPTQIFFDEDQPGAGMRICAVCPVQAACRRFALAHPELTGLWGGLTTEERARFAIGRDAARLAS